MSKRYFSEGIVLQRQGIVFQGSSAYPTWSGELPFWGGEDDESPDFRPTFTQGELHTFAPSSDGSDGAAIRTVTTTLIDDARQLGIELREPSLGCENEEELPAGWKVVLQDEARRLGWRLRDWDTGDDLTSTSGGSR